MHDEYVTLECWRQVLEIITALVPHGSASIVIDAYPGASQPAGVADRLAAALRAAGRPCARLTDETPYADEDLWRAEATDQTVAVADGPRWRTHPPAGRWSLLIWLRTSPGHPGPVGEAPVADVVIDPPDRFLAIARRRR